MTDDLIFAAQVRAARGLLAWSQIDLAEKTGLSRTVIARLEQGVTDARFSTINQIRTTFADAGVTFVTEPAGSFGVHCRARRSARVAK